MPVLTLFSQTGGGTVASDGTSYTMGVQFQVSSTATLDAIWWYSVSGVTVLPYAITLFTTGGSTVHTEGSVGTPITWSGVAGSGWVKASFASPPSLTASTTYVAAVTADPAGSNWYSSTSGYWTSGAGSGGITNGALSAPSNAASVNGQDTFNVGTPVTFPGTSASGSNFWVDPEVTTSGSTVTAQAALTVTPTFAAVMAHTALLGAALTVTPTLHAVLVNVTASKVTATAGTGEGRHNAVKKFLLGIL